MKTAWFGWSGAALTAAFTLFAGGPLKAADNTGVHYVAEELGSRTKTPEAGKTASKGLSDSAVRVMSTFALSILPDKVPGPNGQMVKLDKSDPNKYLIPLDDARRVIRVATRSAYAEVCQLRDLEKDNYNAMVRAEKARQTWTTEQMMFIRALHTFATSYFAGNVKITEQPDTGKAESLAKESAAAANNAAAGATTTITTKKLECAPGQKEKVAAAITSFVQSAPPPTLATVPPTAPTAANPETAPTAANPEPAAEDLPGMSTLLPEPSQAPAPAPAPVAGGAN
jgi:hypothetical protein